MVIFNIFLVAALSVTPTYTNHNRVAGNVQTMTNIQQWASAVETAIGSAKPLDYTTTNAVWSITSNVVTKSYVEGLGIEAGTSAEGVTNIASFVATNGWRKGEWYFYNENTNAFKILLWEDEGYGGSPQFDEYNNRWEVCVNGLWWYDHDPEHSTDWIYAPTGSKDGEIFHFSGYHQEDGIDIYPISFDGFHAGKAQTALGLAYADATVDAEGVTNIAYSVSSNVFITPLNSVTGLLANAGNGLVAATAGDGIAITNVLKVAYAWSFSESEYYNSSYTKAIPTGYNRERAYADSDFTNPKDYQIGATSSGFYIKYDDGGKRIAYRYPSRDVATPTITISALSTYTDADAGRVATNVVAGALTTNNATFVLGVTNAVNNAVLEMVAASANTNAVAILNETLGADWQTYGGGFAGLLAAILAAIAWLKQNKVNNKDITTCSGIKVVTGTPSTYEENVIYFEKASS